MKVAISIGHGPAIDRGAENHDGTTEFDWNLDLGNRIKVALTGTALEAVICGRKVEKSPTDAAHQITATGADFAVELHLNAADTKASGTEMLHATVSARGKELAGHLQREAVAVLGLPNRGVKSLERTERGAAIVWESKPPTVIVESFFIDNDKDLKRGNDEKTNLAQGYARAFLKFAGL